MSAESSRTWVKARKKWTVEDNAALAKKDILHSIRDLLLGTTPLRVAPAAVTVTVAKVVVTMLTVVVKLDEGAELAETGTITHFDAANELAMEMRQETSTEWEYYKRKYQPIYNKARHDTRHTTKPLLMRRVRWCPTNTTHDTTHTHTHHLRWSWSRQAGSRLKLAAPKGEGVEPRRTFLLNPTTPEQLQALRDKLALNVDVEDEGGA